MTDNHYRYRRHHIIIIYFYQAQGPQLTSQDAQLSQRDRAAECVTVLAIRGTLKLGDNILRTL